jgi:type II secretory pathway pseudopilin PulG
MNKQAGLTWVESLMVIAVLGIISGVAVPKLVGMSNHMTNTAKKEAVEAVKSAFAVSIQETQRFPDVTELAEYVDAEGVKPTENGIQVNINGDNYTVATLSSTECLKDEPTQGVSDIVRCIGDIDKMN